MDINIANRIFSTLKIHTHAKKVTPFCSEEDGAQYRVWRIDTDGEPLVLKKVSDREQKNYDAFFPGGGACVPTVYGFTDGFMVMEYIHGHSLSRCTRAELILALDALISLQRQYWENTELASAGCSFDVIYSSREKRLPYMEDLTDCYQSYLNAFRTVPRTLCNDDLLPFNVLVSENRAVILDWEHAGILPYPCALARLLAFGKDRENALFRMSREDQRFAVEYYYTNLIREKGIAYDEYIHTMKLFFFKEYSEWIYCANSSGDFSGEYYQTYSVTARLLAKELGF